MLYLANAFSLSMLPEALVKANLHIATLSRHEAEALLEEEMYTSIVGHESTAKILSKLLGSEVKVNRASVTLEELDSVLVAQYSGPRLPEGATTLPEGASFTYRLVTLL